MNKSRKKAMGGLIFSIGLIVLLIGAMTDIYTATVGVIIALAIWLVGGPIVILLGREKEEPPKQQEQKE